MKNTLFNKLKDNKNKIFLVPFHLSRKNVIKMFEYLLDELKIKYFKKWDSFSSYKNKSVFLTDDIYNVDLSINQRGKKNKSILFVANVENISYTDKSTFEDIKDWDKYCFDTIHKGPKFNYKITLCEENSYDINFLNVDAPKEILINSIIMMFPILYKIIVRIILLEEKNNVIYCDEDLKNKIQHIIEKLKLDVNFYSQKDKNVYENIHFISLPGIEEFYKILNNYTIDKVCFKSHINFWFYINKDGLDKYDEFEKIINKNINTFSKYLTESNVLQCDFNGNVVVRNG